MITRPQITPPSAAAAPRNLARFAFMPPANHWLRMFFGLGEYYACIRDCDGGVVQVTDTAETAVTEIRGANHLAARTIAQNLSDDYPALVYEGGIAVAHLAPGAAAIPDGDATSGADAVPPGTENWGGVIESADWGATSGSLTAALAFISDGSNYLASSFTADVPGYGAVLLDCVSLTWADGPLPDPDNGTLEIVFVTSSIGPDPLVEFTGTIAGITNPAINAGGDYAIKLARVFTPGTTAVPGEMKELPTPGLLVIAAQGVGGAAQIEVTTYLRCACGDSFSYGYGYDDSPVGAFLL